MILLRFYIHIISWGWFCFKIVMEQHHLGGPKVATVMQHALEETEPPHQFDEGSFVEECVHGGKWVQQQLFFFWSCSFWLPSLHCHQVLVLKPHRRMDICCQKEMFQFCPLFVKPGRGAKRPIIDIGHECKLKNCPPALAIGLLQWVFDVIPCPMERVPLTPEQQCFWAKHEEI